MARRRTHFTDKLGRKAVGVASALAVTTLGLLVLSPQTARTEAVKADSRPKVAAMLAKRGTVARRLETNATLEAFETSDLYAKVAGYITDVRVDIGDRVKAGQTLATIDVPELQNDLAEASAQLQARRADRDLQDATFKRQQSLHDEKAITDQALDEAHAKAALGTAQLAEAEAKVKKLRALVAFADIRAPFDGIVARRLVNRGDLVQAATAGRTAPLFTVQRIDTIRAYCDVPESEASHVAVGDEAKIKPFGLSKTFTGKVARFARRLDPDTRNMRTEIDLPNPTGELYSGMYAQIALAMDKHGDAIVVPATALGSDADGSFVLAVERDRIVRKPVQVGIVDGALAEILQGVAEDTVVVMTSKGAPPPDTLVAANVRSAD